MSCISGACRRAEFVEYHSCSSGWPFDGRQGNVLCLTPLLSRQNRNLNPSIPESGELICIKPRFFRSMHLLPRKAVLAVAAVIDAALQEHGRPISAKTLATHHGLPPRHLEPVLQALVRCGILKGVRGPRGGYELARECREVTVSDILRAAGTVDDGEELHDGSNLVQRVILPAISDAEREFGVALSRINVEDLARDAQVLHEAPATPRTAGRALK
jgi:Rrf2 family transcriptional regulator, iron-sulfur cluster assembly transcription factor